MSGRPSKYHEERDSQFYRLRSRAKLASLLFIGMPKLRELTHGQDLYYEFRKPKASGGTRQISAPRDDLKAVQRRVASLLQRIAPPDYLFAPVAGRSYVDNAANHIGAKSIRLLDIEDFFPNCTANKVIWLFHKRLECSPDVSAILRSLVTKDGALPQGSPCSPILAYLSYVDMWSDISKLVDSAGCKLSVYADDLTISGQHVPESVVWNIKMILRKYGHRYKVSKERSKHRKPAEITGVILRANRLHAPNRQHKKLLEVRRDLTEAKSEEAKIKILARIHGRQAQIRQIAVKSPS